MDAAWAVMKICKLFLTLVGKWVCSSHYHLAFILKVRAWFWNPARLGGRSRTGTGPGWRKNRERKNRRDSVGGPRQDPVANSLTFIFFVFLLKWRRFDFKKKNWPNRSGDPVKTRNPGLRLGRSPGRVLKL